MTPFDGAALVAMLRTFYPAVTRANLERAFRERPEYFAGGYLFGRLSDVLVLPDGRAFDIVYAAWTPASQWAANYIDPNATPSDDPFPLDEGPIAYLDGPGFEAAPPSGDFEQLVAGAVQELGAGDDVLGGAAQTIGTSGATPGFGDALSRDVDDLAGGRASQLHALELLRPEDLIAAAGGAGGVIDHEASEYPDPAEAAPPEMDPNDPGPPPVDDVPPPEDVNPPA